MITTPYVSKPHYAILDALRGVAAVMVIIFHLFEAHSTSPMDQLMNHGYLAVDFFFVLSGFVIGYAYDDRWGKMSFVDFAKRRLVRLQPMVVVGMVIGAVCFYFQDSAIWPHIHEVPVWKMLLVLLVGFTLLPLPPSMDIRGWQEMHPLNGPGWSLFFEYVANALYGLGIREFSKTALAVLVFLSGCALVHLAVTSPEGDLIGGWSLEPLQMRIGFTRLMYPFFAGLLLKRIVNLIRIKHAFFWCSLLIIVFLSAPRIGGSDQLWKNGLYDALVVILIFPFIIYMGASGDLKGRFLTRICKFFGDISYPVYITHYPLIYVYTAWVHDHKATLGAAWPWALLVFFSCILLAYGSLKFFDEPVRRWLKIRFLHED